LSIARAVYNNVNIHRMSVLADNLKKIRKLRRISQVELARKAGISQTTISDIERGRNDSTKELPSLAKALGVSVEHLIEKKTFKPIKSDTFERPYIYVKSFDQILTNGQGKKMERYFKDSEDKCIYWEVDTDLMEGPSKYIPKGSIALIDSVHPQEGEIALYVLGQSAAVGVFTVLGDKQFLRPSNTQFQAIDVTYGDLVGVIKQIVVNF